MSFILSLYLVPLSSIEYGFERQSPSIKSLAAALLQRAEDCLRLRSPFQSGYVQ